MHGKKNSDYTVWPSLPGYAYAYKKGKLHVNLIYVTSNKLIVSEAHVPLGATVEILLLPGM